MALAIMEFHFGGLRIQYILFCLIEEAYLPNQEI